MIARLLALDPYAMFLAYVAIFSAVCVLAAAFDVALNHRRTR